MNKTLVLFLVMPLVGMSAANAETVLNGKILSREKIIHNVVLLPPAAYKPRKFDGTDLRNIFIRNPLSTKVQEREEERLEELGRKIGECVSGALRKNGWQVSDSDFSAPTMQANLKMNTLVDSLMASYEVLIRQMRSRPKDVKKGRYSIGKSVADLNLPPSTEVIALLYGIQTIYGRGENKWVDLYMSFADAQTGEILCYFHTNRSLEEKALMKELKRIPR